MSENTEYRGCNIKIDYDESPESPREWEDNSVFIGLKDHHYTVGDEQIDDIEELEERLKEEGKHIGLPVYIYEHSQRFYKTEGSGTINGGFIFITLENIRKEYGWERITKKRRNEIIERLKSEIEIYSQWANGEVYGFTVTDKHGKHIDSCFGFYGSDDSYMMEEAKGSIDYYLDTERPRQIRVEFKQKALHDLQGVG